MEKKISDQTREAIASIMRYPEAIEQLTVKTRQCIVEDPVGFLARLEQVNLTEVPRDVPMTKEELIEWIGKADVSATTEKFIAREKFKLKKDGGICSYLGDNFREWFLKGDGKIEDPIPASKLRYGKLLKGVTDLPQEPGEVTIIPELGGEAQAETTLSEMRDRMGKQSWSGEGGVLLTNGSANIFYIRDQNGVLRAVGVVWDDGGWGVDAGSVDSPNRWDDGCQVFSRNSELKSSVPLEKASS